MSQEDPEAKAICRFEELEFTEELDAPVTKCTHPEGKGLCDFMDATANILEPHECPMFQHAQPLHEAEIEQLLDYEAKS